MSFPFSAPIRQSRKGYRDWRTWPIGDNFGHLLRAISIRIVRDVESGAFLDETADAVFSRSHLTAGQRALIYQLASGVVRWKGYLDAVVSRYTSKPVDRDIRYLLWATFYQVRFMKKAHYHVIKEAVDYAKKKGKFTAGFVNAILRRFVDEKEPAGISEGEAVRYAFPGWLVDRWTDRFGADEALKLMAGLNREPRFTLRVDERRMAVDEVHRRLAEAGIATTSGDRVPSAIVVEKLSPVIAMDLFREGIVTVQGEASQLAGMAVAAAGGMRILDACAGSGTKTRQLREICPGAVIYSMDNELKRLAMSSAADRVICADACEPPFRAGFFDTILVDAPCSSLGIIGKHPEIKWRRREDEIARFGALQLTLLKSLWDLVKPGGRMIYSVCSFEPEETLDVLDNLSKEKTFVLENPLPFLFNRDYFISLPLEKAMDGFFIARLRKQ